MFTLDTNAVIYYLGGDDRVGERLEEIFTQNATTYVSAVTEAELFSFPGLGTEEAAGIERALATLAVIPVGSQVARIAAELRRCGHQKRHQKSGELTLMRGELD